MKRALLIGVVLALVLPLSALGAGEFSYEEAIAACVGDAEYTVERQFTAGPDFTVVLRWQNRYEDRPDIRDYELYLFRSWGEPMVNRLLLPSTALPFEGYAPTDRAPDSLEVGEDGVLTYVYRFEEPLLNENGQVLHEAGIYTYRVNLGTGELTVSHRAGAEETAFRDVFASDWFAPYLEICVEKGLMKGVGDDRFFPEGTLSDHECEVLALRLYDICHGGDGSFEKAPENWGYALLSLPDGTVREGYLADESSWDWIALGRADPGHLGFRLETEAEQEWGRSMDYQSAVLTLSGKEYPGELHLQGPRILYFSFPYSDSDDFREPYNAFQAAQSAPLPGQWWRDAWYYAERHGLEDLLRRVNNRLAFASRIAAVTDLPAVNEIPGLPDTGDPDVLELYQAGILTGGDEYGTFHSYSTLTRAEAAAICARILRPELRLSFSPKPLETYENYTLTYLREDGDRPGGPYRPMQSFDLLIPDDHSLLRLDGAELPVPQGYQVESIGEGLAGVVNWEAETFGLIDREGRFQGCTRQEVFENPLLSVFHYDTEGLINGYQIEAPRSAFYNEKGEQVTPSFDWLSFVDPSGAGFVGLDKKIYRIQFQK